MTVAEAIAALDALNGSDPENAHYEADGILREFAPPEVLAALERLVERADGWWYA